MMDRKLLTIGSIVCMLFLLQGCVIQHPEKADCISKEIKVTNVSEGGEKDLVLHEANGDFYYINRGLENGFTIEGAKAAILNKTVTLHLYKFWFGIESEHISQLEVDGTVLYSEFEEEQPLLNH